MTRRGEQPHVPRIVDRYTREVAARLRGPRAARQEMADEIRDHVLDAIDATGGNPESAESAERTIACFGRPDYVASQIQPGLSRRLHRRTALALLGITTGICALWFGIFVSGPHAPWTESREPTMLAWSDIAGAAAMKAAITAGVVAVLFSWILPRLARSVALVERAGVWAARSCLFGIAALALGVATIFGYALARGLLAPGSLEWSDIGVGALISLIALSAVGRLGTSASLVLGDR